MTRLQEKVEGYVTKLFESCPAFDHQMIRVAMWDGLREVKEGEMEADTLELRGIGDDPYLLSLCASNLLSEDEPGERFADFSVIASEPWQSDYPDYKPQTESDASQYPACYLLELLWDNPDMQASENFKQIIELLKEGDLDQVKSLSPDLIESVSAASASLVEQLCKQLENVYANIYLSQSWYEAACEALGEDADAVVPKAKDLVDDRPTEPEAAEAAEAAEASEDEIVDEDTPADEATEAEASESETESAAEPEAAEPEAAEDEVVDEDAPADKAMEVEASESDTESAAEPEAAEPEAAEDEVVDEDTPADKATETEASESASASAAEPKAAEPGAAEEKVVDKGAPADKATEAEAGESESEDGPVDLEYNIKYPASSDEKKPESHD